MKTLLTISELSKAYGTQVLFKDADVAVSDTQKIGLIGKNGAGKSTLLRIITGEEESDAGSVLIHPGTHIGYLRQQDEFLAGETVMDYLLRVSERPEWQCGKAAYRFELTTDWLDRPIASLSGGYQMRVKLAAMIAREPNLILLDEPTNYLDLATVILLEQFIREFRGSVILISHDREFLKRTCDHTMEVEHGVISLFPRALEEYLEHKAVSREAMERYNQKVEKQKAHLQSFIDRFGAKASKAAQAQSKMKQISRLSTIEIKNPLPTVDITIPKTDQVSGNALRINALGIGYDGVPVASGLSLDIDKGEHVAILGNNGQGKSTLLATLADRIPPVSGAYRWTPSLTVGYFGGSIMDDMNPSHTVYDYLKQRAGRGVKHEEVMRMAGAFLFRNDGLEKKIGVLSGGEKSRLALAALLLTKAEVLLLDEPTNHLDFETAEALALALASCNRTVLFISHDRTFVSQVADRLVEIRDGRMREYLNGYQEYVDVLLAEAARYAAVSQPQKKLSSEEKDMQRERQKELSRDIRKLEHAIADLQKERAVALRSFEQSPAYDRVRTEQFSALEAEIKKQEHRWAELTHELEALREH